MVDFPQEEQKRGTWVNGPHAGQSGGIVAYRAGHLLTRDGDCQQWGDPKDFLTVEGQDGEAFLDERLPFPKIDTFYYGAVREAIASAHFHAVSGNWCGNVNFGDKGQYCCVDNQQGEDALVQFLSNLCVGVVSSGDPTRTYDVAMGISKAPLECQKALQDIVANHEQWFCRPATGLFWSDGDRLTGHEPFRILHSYGFETMEEFCLDDERWSTHFANGCDSTTKIAKSIIAVAKQYCLTRCPVEVSSEDLETIFPKNAPARDDALKAVTSTEYAVFIAPPE